MDVEIGVTNEQSMKVAAFLGFNDSLVRTAASQIRNLYNLFINIDATQVEINPFAETHDDRGKLIYLKVCSPLPPPLCCGVRFITQLFFFIFYLVSCPFFPHPTGSEKASSKHCTKRLPMRTSRVPIAAYLI